MAEVPEDVTALPSQIPGAPYIYEPLSYDDPRHHPIRLLRIERSEPGSPISCTLFPAYLAHGAGNKRGQNAQKMFQQLKETLNLDKAPSSEYTALSYVWGDAKDRIDIRVNGKRLLVTRNLWLFLRRQRETFSKSSAEQLFWIDAICIDQSNIEERNRQVEFMAEVYKQAILVLVWLGEETVHTQVAFDAVRNGKYLDGAERNEARTAMRATFEGGWWTRLWVVQEAALAKKITVRCGTLEISWEILVQSSKLGAAQYSSDLFNVAIIERTKSKMIKLRSKRMAPRFDVPELVLDSHGQRKCLDARDAIFAMRSLSRTLMSVRPDYSKSTAAIFTSAARAMISKSGNLTILERPQRMPSECEIFDRDPLPSWVPDWTKGPVGRLPSPEDIGQVKTKFVHDHRLSEQILSYQDPAVLLLRGLVLDRLSLATIPYTTSDTQRQLRQWFPEWKGDVITDEGRPHDLKIFNLGAIIDDFVQRRGHEIPAFVKIKEFVDQMHVIDLQGKSFIITTAGYKGFVLGDPEAGDILFEAYGSRFPLVLRRHDEKGSRYTFVGCAVVEEFMAGEANEMMKAGKLEEQTIELV